MCFSGFSFIEKSNLVIDLARLACAFAPLAYSQNDVAYKLIQSLVRASELNLQWSVPLEKHRDVNTLLLLRTLANAIHPDVLPTGLDWMELVLAPLETIQYSSMNKNQRTALTSFLFNLSTIYLEGKSEMKVLNQDNINQMIVKILREERESSEAFYRALMALGNMVYCYRETHAKLEHKAIEAISAILEDAPTRFTEKRIVDVAKEIRFLLGSL